MPLVGYYSLILYKAEMFDRKLSEARSSNNWEMLTLDDSLNARWKLFLRSYNKIECESRKSFYLLYYIVV